RNRSHWSTSKTPSYTKSVSWQHHPISEHLQIGIRAIDLLRAEGDRLHSRKLRTFNEPPFR
ncbi:hypothetical protein, partial [Escherichia coli]|uniref:hypothetical protein n=1 Tax=Escherichia coli TaxID=562 RepID=UPI002B24B4AC